MKRQELEKINTRFLGEHYMITDNDLKMANDYIEILEKTRDEKKPIIGDIVRFTNEYGEFYKYAHIDEIRGNKAYICEMPYTPFMYVKDDKTFSFSTSGGSWQYLDITKFKYLGKEKKKFCNWAVSTGACGNGAIDFIAEVNVWEFKSKNKYGKFSTEFYDKMYIHFRDKEQITQNQYTIVGEGNAWKNIEEYELFKKTYKACEFDGSWKNQKVIFFYKEINHYIEKKEWEKLKLPEDTRQCNGIITVKVKYNDKKKTIDVYRYTNSGEFGDKCPKLYKFARAKKPIKGEI